jgi:Cdc6-like AAA superfamily ATPase
MIIVIYGKVGTGKTLSAVRMIARMRKKAFTNFDVKLPNVKRLNFSDILKLHKEKMKSGYEKTVYTGVNWKFWNDASKKNPDFSIFLDETGQFLNSRRSFSNRNVYMGEFLAQIRKVLSDKEDNHLVIITQRLNKIDIDFREMAHIFIQCEKVKTAKGVWIINKYYDSLEALEAGHKPRKKTIFRAEPYYKLYNTKSYVIFGDSDDF